MKKIFTFLALVAIAFAAKSQSMDTTYDDAFYKKKIHVEDTITASSGIVFPDGSYQPKAVDADNLFFLDEWIGNGDSILSTDSLTGNDIYNHSNVAGTKIRDALNTLQDDKPNVDTNLNLGQWLIFGTYALDNSYAIVSEYQDGVDWNSDTDQNDLVVLRLISGTWTFENTLTDN